MFILGILLALATNFAFADIDVHIAHVGLPGTTPFGGGRVDYIRPGLWTPVNITVSLVGQAVFDGELRIEQFDDDGDLCYDAVPIHLSADTGGAQQYFLYIPANPSRQRKPFYAEVLDAEGGVVEIISNGERADKAFPTQQPEVIGHDAYFILEISEGGVSRLTDLIDLPKTGIKFAREPVVGHLAPKDFPPLWFGLEMVDCIVWENAKPESLSLQQLQALVQWVEYGGTLIISSAETASALTMASETKSLMPAELGNVKQVTFLPKFRSQMLGDFDNESFIRPVQIVEAEALPDATVILADGEAGDLITRRPFGHGIVFFCGITLKDAFRETGNPGRFFRKLLSLQPEQNADQMLVRKSLFDYVIAAVNFSTSGSVYLLIAVLFSVIYVVISTFGAWGVLAARGWRQHNWGVFGLIVVATSFLSIIAVRAVLGIETKLHQISIMDVQAGESIATATAFFGLKTPSESRLDVWLPSDHLSEEEPTNTGCYLKPLPVSGEPTGLDYADSTDYRLVPGSGEIQNLMMRATLKRLEGRWIGSLGGRFTGNITVKRGPEGGKDWRFTNDSYVVNDLGVDLHNCFVFHTLYSSHDFDVNTREDLIYVYEVGTIPSDGGPFKLATACYKSGNDKQIYEKMKQQLLGEVSDNSWASKFRSLLGNVASYGNEKVNVTSGQEQEALMLLSTIGEFNPVRNPNNVMGFGITTFSRDRLRQLDLRTQLQREYVYVIGFARDPGPIRLAVGRNGRYRTMYPEEAQSWTMYRIRIPVVSPGKASLPKPSDANEEEEERSLLDRLFDG